MIYNVAQSKLKLCSRLQSSSSSSHSSSTGGGGDGCGGGGGGSGGVSSHKVSHEVATKSQHRSSDRKRSPRIILKLILRCEYRLILKFIQQKQARGMKASKLTYDRI